MRMLAHTPLIQQSQVAHLFDHRMIPGQRAERAVSKEKGFGITHMPQPVGVLADGEGGEGRLHPGEVGVSHAHVVNVEIRVLDGAAEVATRIAPRVEVVLLQDRMDSFRARHRPTAHPADTVGDEKEVSPRPHQQRVVWDFIPEVIFVLRPDETGVRGGADLQGERCGKGGGRGRWHRM